MGLMKKWLTGMKRKKLFGGFVKVILNVRKLFNKDRKDCKKDKSFLSKKKVDSTRKRKKYLKHTKENIKEEYIKKENIEKEFSGERVNEDNGVLHKMQV